jgi:hypothetical protein
LSNLAEPTELLRFDGIVECGRRGGAIALQLRGAACEAPGGASGGAPRGTPREGAGITELLFAGLRDPLPALPAQLHEARVLQVPPSPAAVVTGRTATAYRLEAREGRFELQAHSVQLHREAAAAFFRAVPPAPVPRAVRLGWGVLLALLRLPGAARLLDREPTAPGARTDT